MYDNRFKNRKNTGEELNTTFERLLIKKTISAGIVEIRNKKFNPTETLKRFFARLKLFRLI